MKKGITATSIAILVVVVLILGSTITIASMNSIETSTKLVFGLEISNIQENVTKYVKNNEDSEYPITDKIYTVDLSNVTVSSVAQFNGETRNNNKITLYEVDLSYIGISDTKYGLKNDRKDVYVLSKETGRVYYLAGIKTKDKTYYTLTDDLIEIKDRNEKTKAESTPIENPPVITTRAFVVNKNGDSSEIYLKNISVEGEGITKVKYDKNIIDNSVAEEYFKTNGVTLTGDRIKMQEGEYVTIYAENSSGKYSIWQGGICTIPAGSYYVGGSILQGGVVVSNNASDANKGIWATDTAGLSTLSGTYNIITE